MGAIIAAMLLIVAIAGGVVWATARPDEAARTWDRLRGAVQRTIENLRNSTDRNEPQPMRARARTRR